MRWLELTVEADAEAVEAVSEVLGRVSDGTAVRPTRTVPDPSDELALREDHSAPYLVTAHIPHDAAAAAAVESTERALWHLQAFGLRPVGELRVQTVEDDWTDAWRRHYVPQRVGRVVIVPSWIDEPLRDGEVAVHMDPGMAFGTGLHPTTRACLELLQAVEQMPARVLDVGCGSGILALAALALGAGHAVGYDTDAVAVDAARGNAALNDTTERFDVLHGTLPEHAVDRFEVVLANLVAVTLVQLAQRLAAHTQPGGTLLASGIVAQRSDEVLAALEASGFRRATRRTDDDWVSLRLVRAG